MRNVGIIIIENVRKTIIEKQQKTHEWLWVAMKKSVFIVDSSSVAERRKEDEVSSNLASKCRKNELFEVIR